MSPEAQRRPHDRQRTFWWWIAAIFTPIGILGGPIAGADLLAGVIEWRGPFRYMTAFWEENIAAPIGTIANFLFSSLNWPAPSEFAVDYATLALLLAGSFIRMRRLMHPVESLQQSKRSLKNLMPPTREAPHTELSISLPFEDERASAATPDFVVLGTAPESVTLGTRSAGAFEAIDREFAPMSAPAFAATIVASTLFWPLSALILLALLARDLAGWTALQWGAPVQTVSRTASRAIWSRDPQLIEFARAQLLARWQRYLLAVAPFLLFFLLFVANQALTPVASTEVVFAISVVSLFGLSALVWTKIRKHPNDDVARALARAERTIRRGPPNRSAG